MKAIKLLKRLGCEVVSRESTKAAKKWWLTYPPVEELTHRRVERRAKRRKLVLEALELTDSDLYCGEYHHADFILNFQTEEEDGHTGIFIAKPKRNKAGEEYRHGIDG